MIEINLLPSESRGRSARERHGSAAAPQRSTRVALDAWVVGLATVATGIVLLLVFTTWRVGVARAAIEIRIATEVADSARFASTIAMLDLLQARQDTIQQKIEVIRTVDTRRYLWPRLLDEIDKAVPPFTWLSRIASTGAGGDPALTLEGNAKTTEDLTRFMKNLESSPLLRDVTLVTSEQARSDDRSYQRFTLEAHAQQPDSALIETVPVLAVR